MAYKLSIIFFVYFTLFENKIQAISLALGKILYFIYFDVIIWLNEVKTCGIVQ